MRQILAIIMVLNVMLFKGCSKINNGNPQNVYSSTAPQIMFDKIISALDDNDSEQLKSLFSQNSIAKTPDIDAELTDLMTLYQGKFVSNSPFDTGAMTGASECGEWVYMVINPDIKEIKTDKAVYSLVFNSVPVKSDFPDDVGLWCIWLELKDGDKVIDECQVGVSYPGK